MPLTLSCGLSRKVGEANFSSRGASVNFTVEVEATAIREPNELRDKIRYLFALAKQSIEEELAGGAQQDDTSRDANGNNANGNRRSPNSRQATASQVRAIHAIAHRNRIDLPTHLRDRFGVGEAEDLLIGQASELIDELKAAGNGMGKRR